MHSRPSRRHSLHQLDVLSAVSKCPRIPLSPLNKLAHVPQRAQPFTKPWKHACFAHLPSKPLIFPMQRNLRHQRRQKPTKRCLLSPPWPQMTGGLCPWQLLSLCRVRRPSGTYSAAMRMSVSSEARQDSRRIDKCSGAGTSPYPRGNGRGFAF